MIDRFPGHLASCGIRTRHDFACTCGGPWSMSACICDGFKSDGTCRHTRESGVLPENTESAWLIEQSGNAIRYATVEDGMFAWTPDVSEAIRFSRRDDAEMYAELIGDDDVHIREHVWTDTPKRITEQHTPKRIVSDLPTGESEEPKS